MRFIISLFFFLLFLTFFMNTIHFTRSGILHSVEKLHVTAKGILSDSINIPANYERIDTLAQAMGVAQHHGLSFLFSYFRFFSFSFLFLSFSFSFLFFP